MAFEVYLCLPYMACGTNVCHQCTLQMEAKQAFGQQKNKAAALFVAGLSMASYPWAWLMFLGMSIRLSAWGFGVAHGSYSGDEAGDLTGISFEESGSNLMDSVALGIAGPSGKLALLDSLTRWNHWWLPLGPLSLPWLLVSVASLGFSWCTYEYVYMKAAN